eukprot:14401189-Alexandrium_andersonii.AAC.1
MIRVTCLAAQARCAVNCAGHLREALARVHAARQSDDALFLPRHSQWHENSVAAVLSSARDR